MTVVLVNMAGLADDMRVRHAVILAGGSGTRLWPLSHRAMPKQLLPLGAGGETLLSAAARRVAGVVSAPPLVITATTFLEASRRALPNAEYIAEPMGRNTAPALALAAALLAARDPAAIMVALPADQHIADEAGFEKILQTAFAAVEHDDVICTIGIVPTRPETGYGYLELAARADANMAVAVTRFVEKPNLEMATAYVNGGRYLWNAGIFVVSAQRLLREVARHLPELSQGMTRIAAAIPAGSAAVEAAIADVYPGLPSISIDYGIMERTDRVVTVAADIGWDDIGSWASLPTMLGHDANNNSCAGTTLVLDGTGNIAVAERGVIALLGCTDLVVVRRGDTVLVMPKDRAQDVRSVVDALAARGLTRYL